MTLQLSANEYNHFDAEDKQNQQQLNNQPPRGNKAEMINYGGDMREVDGRTSFFGLGNFRDLLQRLILPAMEASYNYL